MKEIKYEESRGTRPILPSTLPSHRPFTQLKLYQTVWFPKLIVLMFLLALSIAASVLFIFPSFTDILANRDALEWLTIFYCLLFGVYTLVLMIFIVICLAIQFKYLRLPQWVEGWKQSYIILDQKKRLIIQISLWTTLIGSIITALGLFVFKGFFWVLGIFYVAKWPVQYTS